MDDRPRWNEDQSYRYPTQRLVAVFADRATADEALARLREVEVDLSQVNVLSGPDGAALLDRHGQRQRLRGRLLRALQWTSSENDRLDLHDATLRNGGLVVYVPVRGENRKERVAQALRAAGGHGLVYHGRWTTEKRQI